MRELLADSLYFGAVISVGTYLFGMWLRKKVPLAILNPLLVSILLTIGFLLIFGIEYEEYNKGADYISYFLTPATVCLAIPLYKQLELLKRNLAAAAGGIVSGVLASACSIFALSRFFGLGHEHYVTLLPKSITTAIAIGVSEEAGGIAALTVVSIVITGIFGNVMADVIFKLFHIKEPVAKGLALGTSAHAMGTSRALELGEIEGAMSSLSIAVAGLLTVIVVPLVSGLI